jgi:hypothetical protein
MRNIAELPSSAFIPAPGTAQPEPNRGTTDDPIKWQTCDGPMNEPQRRAAGAMAGYGMNCLELSPSRQGIIESQKPADRVA